MRPAWWLAAVLVLAVPVLLLGLWKAIHSVGWLGPFLADTGRFLLGNTTIAKLEDWAYAAQDRYNTATRGEEKPTARWVVPPKAPEPEASADVEKPAKYPAFTPKDVGPMFTTFAAPGDGQWVAIPDTRTPGEPAPMAKTLVHPDKKRGWASVAVMAADLRQVRLHLVAGVHEPMTKLPDAKAHKRTGLIPESDFSRVLAAWNGGFKTTHGNYGMKAEGVLWVVPRVRSCTIAMYAEDRLTIASWESMEKSEPEMVWFRQTPMCMYEEGAMHKGLTVEDNTHWGATLDKDTVIRRSALGLSADKQTLFVGISEATTATAIAKAMNFVGAADVAQLDVNWSYPKAFTVEPKGGGDDKLVVKPIVDGFEFTEDDYVRKEMSRDFFYLTRLETPKAP